MPKGYYLDALVVIEGKDIGIEVDGPFRFYGRKPNGKMILKRRQVINLEGITLVYVPYWEWVGCATGKDHCRKKAYLRSLLGIDEMNQKIQEVVLRLKLSKCKIECILSIEAPLSKKFLLQKLCSKSTKPICN